MKYRLEINVLGPIKNSKLELKPGVTIIFGPTASGKSILLSTITALLYRKYGESFQDIIRELLDKYPLEEFNIKFNDETFTDKEQLLRNFKEHAISPMVFYLPAYRLMSYYIVHRLYEDMIKDIVAEVIRGKDFHKAFRTVLSMYVTKTYEDLLKMFAETSSKEFDKWIKDLQKISGRLYQLTSWLAVYNMLGYLMASGAIVLDPRLSKRINDVFNKYFKDLGEIIITKYAMKYKHLSGFITDITMSSDGVKELNYYIVVREAFHDQVLFTIIDEIELHLYPRTLIGFLDYLLDSNKESNSYVLLSSHSLYTVAWGIKQIMNNQPVRLYIMKKRSDGYYELSEPDLERPFEGFEDLYMELLLEHRRME